MVPPKIIKLIHGGLSAIWISKTLRAAHILNKILRSHWSAVTGISVRNISWHYLTHATTVIATLIAHRRSPKVTTTVAPTKAATKVTTTLAVRIVRRPAKALIPSVRIS